MIQKLIAVMKMLIIIIIIIIIIITTKTIATKFMIKIMSYLIKLFKTSVF